MDGKPLIEHSKERHFKIKNRKLRGANMSKIYNWTAALLIACLTVLMPLTVAAQSGDITCESINGQYQYCRANTQNIVRVTNQLSNAVCGLDYSWGYDYQGIWVDRGCRASFKYGRSGGGGGNGGRIGPIFGGGGSNNNQGGKVDPEKSDTYDQGYRYGGQDWDQGIPPYYESHNNHYTAQYESDFADGYADGYHHRSHK